MRLRWRLAKNALANLAKGGAAGVVALLLPPLLVRHMSVLNYSVWVLVMQAAAYVAYLDLGLQTAVGRYVAFAQEQADTDLRDSVFSTAIAGLSVASLLAILFLVIAAAVAPLLFPQIPLSLLPPMRRAILIVGGSVALGLPASAWSGVYVGLQRNEVPAIITGTSRLISAIAVVVVVLHGGSLVAMAFAIGLVNFCSYALQYLVLRIQRPEFRFVMDSIRRATVTELGRYCMGISVMSFSMLLVTGLDLILVGHFEFSAVTPYSVAATLITFVTGIIFAIMNAVMPHGAALNARGDTHGLGRVLISSTRMSAILLVFVSTTLIIYAGPLIKLWIGKQFVSAGRPILIVLVIASLVRLTGAAYAVLLVATGQHSFVKISPLAEGLTNLAASLTLGTFLGAMGVALGTLVGAVSAMGAHFFYSMPRTSSAISFSRKELAQAAILVPALWNAPLGLLALASIFGTQPSFIYFPFAAGFSIIGTFLCLHRSGELDWKSLMFLHAPKQL